MPPSDCPDLLALTASRRTPVDKARYPGLTAIDTHRDVYGQHRRVVLIHSQDLHDDQAVERRRFCRILPSLRMRMGFAGLVGTVTPIVAR